MKNTLLLLISFYLSLLTATAKYPSHVYRHTEMPQAMAEAIKDNKPILLLVTKEKTT